MPVLLEPHVSFLGYLADSRSNTFTAFPDAHPTLSQLLKESFTQEAQLMLTTGAMRLAVSRGQLTWYHFGYGATFR